jgi:hypothetical protein
VLWCIAVRCGILRYVAVFRQTVTSMHQPVITYSLLLSDRLRFSEVFNSRMHFY